MRHERMVNDADEDVPVLVFSGPYAEAVFVKTLIESAGIETSLYQSAGRAVHIEPRVLVRRADAEHASELVADFLKNGHRTSY
jgi:hypothetical protein